MMRAGRLRHFIKLDAPVTTLDSDGASVEEWVPQFGGMLIAADIAPLSGRELIAADAVQSNVDTRIVVRYRPGYAASWRVRHREQVYNIRAILPDKDSLREHVTLLCSSGVNDG